MPLRSDEYSKPEYAFNRFKPVHEELSNQSTGQRTIGPDDYKAKGVMYLLEEVEEAHYDYHLTVPENQDIWKAVNTVIKMVTETNPSTPSRVLYSRPFGKPRPDSDFKNIAICR